MVFVTLVSQARSLTTSKTSAVAKNLIPLGNPPPNGIKFFATADVLEVVKDRAWLTKVTNTINQHWHRQNSRKTSGSVNGSQNGHSSLVDPSAASAAR